MEAIGKSIYFSWLPSCCSLLAAVAGAPRCPAGWANIVSPTADNPNIDPSDTSANWTSSRYDLSGSADNALQTSITEANVGTLRPVWEFNGTVGSYSSVAVSDGVVYRTEQGGNTYAINETTGIRFGTLPPCERGIRAPPLVAGGLVYFPSGTGDFYVVGAQTGQTVFSYPAQSAWGPLITGPLQTGQYRGHYRGAPVIDGGTLYIGASNHLEPGECIQGGQVLALDPLSPTTLATATLTPNQTNGVGVWSRRYSTPRAICTWRLGTHVALRLLPMATACYA